MIIFTVDDHFQYYWRYNIISQWTMYIHTVCQCQYFNVKLFITFIFILHWYNFPPASFLNFYSDFELNISSYSSTVFRGIFLLWKLIRVNFHFVLFYWSARMSAHILHYCSVDHVWLIHVIFFAWNVYLHNRKSLSF